MDDCLQPAGNDLTANMCAEKKRRKRSLYKHNILGAMGTDEPEFKLNLPNTPKLANFAELDVRFTYFKKALPSFLQACVP